MGHDLPKIIQIILKKSLLRAIEKPNWTADTPFGLYIYCLESIMNKYMKTVKKIDTESLLRAIAKPKWTTDTPFSLHTYCPDSKMNNNMKTVKKIDIEPIITANSLLQQKNRRAYSIYVLSIVVFLLIGLVTYSVMEEINSSVLVSSSVKKKITQEPQQQAVVSEIKPVYLKPVISERKNLRLCYDYPDENIFEC
jgi:hypothetical protein